MASDVDAVIAALNIVLHEAETRTTTYQWKTRVLNRWLNQLPGAWAGRWWHLKLRGDFDREVSRADLITHLRATLAYLETNRETIRATRAWSWPFKPARRQPQPIDAEFKDVFEPTGKSDKKPGKSVRLIKGDG